MTAISVTMRLTRRVAVSGSEQRETILWAPLAVCTIATTTLLAPQTRSHGIWRHGVWQPPGLPNPGKTVLVRLAVETEGYCAGNSVDWASYITSGGFHFPVRASLCGA